MESGREGECGGNRGWEELSGGRLMSRGDAAASVVSGGGVAVHHTRVRVVARKERERKGSDSP